MIQLNGLLIGFLVVFLFRSGFQIALDLLNISHLRKHRFTVPHAFQDTVDADKFAKIASYTADSAKFGMVSRLFDQAVLLGILLSGVLPWLVAAING
jgi:STE24 endopeptidase